MQIVSNGKVFRGIFKKGKLIEDQSLKDCDRNKSPKTYNNCQLVYGIVHSVDGSKYGDDPDKFKGFCDFMVQNMDLSSILEGFLTLEVS